MVPLLPMATTAVSSANVVVVDSGEVGRSAVYSRYNIGPRTLSLGIPTLTEVCVLTFNFYEEVYTMQM
jgi:hypothetical protein